MGDNEREALTGLSNNELIELVMKLKSDLTKVTEDFRKITNLRLYHLERNQNLSLQYGRRESFEISGIPETIPGDKLEDEVIEIMKEAKVTVNRQSIKNGYLCSPHAWQ